LATADALDVSAATGSDAIVDSLVVEGDCAADGSVAALVSDADPVKLVWFATGPALARSIPLSVDGARLKL
jgi:hypothetical protein